MQRGPISDSPLFWLMLFASVGLVMLAAVEPKFARRQERIERMQQSRQRAAQRNRAASKEGRASERSAVPEWQPAGRATLRPLMLFVAGLLVAAMIGMHIRRRRHA
ncbi:MAG TPA: hypothetical protein VNH11_07820 [Pirellulales bacterium]|nr:hypothetical protein [Pirellulales bacterium]